LGKEGVVYNVALVGETLAYMPSAKGKKDLNLNAYLLRYTIKETIYKSHDCTKDTFNITDRH